MRGMTLHNGYDEAKDTSQKRSLRVQAQDDVHIRDSSHHDITSPLYTASLDSSVERELPHLPLDDDDDIERGLGNDLTSPLIS